MHDNNTILTFNVLMIINLTKCDLLFTQFGSRNHSAGSDIAAEKHRTIGSCAECARIESLRVMSLHGVEKIL